MNVDNQIDLRDMAVFERELQKTRTASEVRDLTAERTRQLGLVSRDGDGIYHAAAGVDERVETSGDGIREERYVVGTKMIELSGTGKQIEQMKAELLKNGLDISKCRRI